MQVNLIKTQTSNVRRMDLRSVLFCGCLSRLRDAIPFRSSRNKIAELPIKAYVLRLL